MNGKNNNYKYDIIIVKCSESLFKELVLLTKCTMLKHIEGKNI